jgi:diadenosine tetraphosphatase ApaH/serine/threonine PP2A family protein phosphatase
VGGACLFGSAQLSVTYPKTALISDLHGNWPALEVAVADARTRGVERFVCLGDVVGYGAKPRECLELVMGLIDPTSPAGKGLLPGLCLQGNHEYALLHSAEDFNPNARAAIEWTRGALSQGVEQARVDQYWEFLAKLEPLLVEPGAMFAHGSPRDPVREYMLPRDSRDAAKMKAVFARMRPFDAQSAYACFVGHSHVPAIFYEDGRFYRPKQTEGPYALAATAENRALVNVGSVGQPRDGDPRLSYAVFDGANVSFVRLEYDVARAQADIRAVSELPVYLADRLEKGQ